MSKMQEAFERWATAQGFGIELDADGDYAALSTKDSWLGFQAALADVKAGGVQAVIIHKSMGDDLDWDRDGWQPANGFTDLYKLPEDV